MKGGEKGAKSLGFKILLLYFNLMLEKNESLDGSCRRKKNTCPKCASYAVA
jgi:hypothetical protein